MKRNIKHVNIPVQMHYLEMYIPRNTGVQLEFEFCGQAPEQVVKNLLTLSARQDINEMFDENRMVIHSDARTSGHVQRSENPDAA